MLNQMQLEALISTMEEAPKLAKKQITEMGWHGHDKFKVDWNQLFEFLNQSGPFHTLRYYKNKWESLKSEARQSMAEYLHANSLTGNKNNQIKLSETCERISAIFGAYGTGQPVLPEVGVKNPMERINPIDGFENYYTEKKNEAQEEISDDNSDLLEGLDPVQFFKNYDHEMILMNNSELVNGEIHANSSGRLLERNLDLGVLHEDLQMQLETGVKSMIQKYAYQKIAD